MIVIYVFSFDQGGISELLRSRGFQKLGLWSYSIYMVHIFVFQIAKMAVSYIGHKTHLDLVGWHNNEKLVLLGTPEHAVWFALVLSVVLVVPVAALTYRWIEKPALDSAKRRVKVRAVGSAIKAKPDMTLVEVAEMLEAELGVSFAPSSVWRFFDRHAVTFKKNRARSRAGQARRRSCPPGLA